MEDFLEKVTSFVDRAMAAADGEARQEEVAGRQEEADADAARSLAAKLNEFDWLVKSGVALKGFCTS